MIKERKKAMINFLMLDRSELEKNNIRFSSQKDADRFIKIITEEFRLRVARSVRALDKEYFTALDNKSEAQASAGYNSFINKNQEMVADTIRGVTEKLDREVRQFMNMIPGVINESRPRQS